MKGPYERLKYDMRRVWECPVCHHLERTDGSVTAVYCRCQSSEKPVERRCMTMVAEGGRRTDQK